MVLYRSQYLLLRADLEKAVTFGAQNGVDLGQPNHPFYKVLYGLEPGCLKDHLGLQLVKL